MGWIKENGYAITDLGRRKIEVFVNETLPGLQFHQALGKSKQWVISHYSGYLLGEKRFASRKRALESARDRLKGIDWTRGYKQILRDKRAMKAAFSLG